MKCRLIPGPGGSKRLSRGLEWSLRAGGTGVGFAASLWACCLAQVGSKFRRCGDLLLSGKTPRRPRRGLGRLRGRAGRSRTARAAAIQAAFCSRPPPGSPRSSLLPRRPPLPVPRAPRGPAAVTRQAARGRLALRFVEPGTGAASLPVAASLPWIGGGSCSWNRAK